MLTIIITTAVGALPFVANGQTFSRFLKDMGEKPKGCSIERKNNNAGYCPENCIWASKKDQANNRRGNILIDLNGV